MNQEVRHHKNRAKTEDHMFLIMKGIICIKCGGISTAATPRARQVFMRRHKKKHNEIEK